MNDDQSPAAQKEQAPPVERVRPPRRTLPTDRIALHKQLDILRAVGQLGETGSSVSNQALGEIVKLHPSTISMANPFFNDAGFFTKSADGQVPAQAVIEMARLWQWDQVAAGHKLAVLLRDTWFGAQILPRLRFRPHTRQDVLTSLADASGASPKHRAQLEMLLGYLEFAGLIRVDGETVLFVSTEAPDESTQTQHINERIERPGTPVVRVNADAMLVHELVIPGGDGAPATLSVPKAATVDQLKAIWAQLDALKAFLEAQANVRNPLQGGSASNG